MSDVKFYYLLHRSSALQVYLSTISVLICFVWQAGAGWCYNNLQCFTLHRLLLCFLTRSDSQFSSGHRSRWDLKVIKGLQWGMISWRKLLTICCIFFNPAISGPISLELGSSNICLDFNINRLYQCQPVRLSRCQVLFCSVFSEDMILLMFFVVVDFN